MPHIIKFADALETVLVNNHPFNIKFGGYAVPITVNKARHYIRLTELPPDVKPGQVEIVSMSHTRPPWPAPTQHAKQPLRAPADTRPEEGTETEHEPALPMHEPALPVRGGLSGLYLTLIFFCLKFEGSIVHI